MNIPNILELHDLALKTASTYPHPRPLLVDLQARQGRHFTGILGPRGVGKTVLLRQLAAQSDNSLYLSLDTLDRDTDLFHGIKRLHLDYGIQRFFLDEVHFHPAIESVLKTLYDTLDIQLWFTSSVALSLHASAYDLSRRVLLRTLYPFSFREYLQFRHGIEVPPLTLEDIFQRGWSGAHMRAGIYFDDYLKGGLMPFAMQEPEPLEILRAILTTVIQRDIPRAARLHTDELELLEKLITYIGRSPVDGINYSTLARNLGITKYKAEQYLALFEQSFILQRVFPKGTNVLQEPKVLLAPPYRLLFREWPDAIGGLREDFFAEAMRQRATAFSYLKTVRGSKTPDFVIETDDQQRTVIEIGGKGKKSAQFKNFKADRRYIFTHSDNTEGDQRPLCLLGML